MRLDNGRKQERNKVLMETTCPVWHRVQGERIVLRLPNLPRRVERCTGNSKESRLRNVKRSSAAGTNCAAQGAIPASALFVWVPEAAPNMPDISGPDMAAAGQLSWRIFRQCPNTPHSAGQPRASTRIGKNRAPMGHRIKARAAKLHPNSP